MRDREQRERAIHLRLTGNRPHAVAELLGVSRQRLYQILKPTPDDPTTVRECARCKTPFRTGNPDERWCGRVCGEGSVVAPKKVAVIVDPLVWAALGYDFEEVTAATVREVVARYAGLTGQHTRVEREREESTESPSGPLRGVTRPLPAPSGGCC